jgi:multiple sugar transport system permease protein
MELSQQQMQDAQADAVTARFRKGFGYLLNYGVMIVLAFFFLFPIIFMVVASFKPNDRVIADLDGVQAFLPDPSTLTTENIEDVFDRVPFTRYTMNSIFLTLTTVIVGLFVNSMAAFVLSRMDWIGRKLLLGIIVSLIIIPLEAIAVPLMLQVNTYGTLTNVLVLGILGLLMVLLWRIFWDVSGQISALNQLPTPLSYLVRAIFALMLALPVEILIYLMIGQTRDGGSWLESYHVQILPFIAEPFSIFLFYQFFIGIPKDFDEAAFVDGADYFRIYWQIMVPLSRPVFATIAILKFLQFWAFYLWPLMVTRQDTYRPLMVGMDFFQTQAPIRWGSIMAYAALVTIPVLIVFLMFQKWFVQSVSSSGVKG